MMTVSSTLFDVRETLDQWFFNGIADFVTKRIVRRTIDGDGNVISKPRLSATQLALGSTAIFLVGAGSFVGIALATFGIDVVASFLVENIATTAWISVLAGMFTAGLIDFVSRMYVADKEEFFCGNTDALKLKGVTTLMSCTGLPCLFFLLSHAILFMSALINALTLTLSPHRYSKQAWNEASENF